MPFSPLFKLIYLLFIIFLSTHCKKDDSSSATSAGNASSGSNNSTGTVAILSNSPRWESLDLDLKISTDFDLSEHDLFISMGELWENAAGLNFFNFAPTYNKDYDDLMGFLDDEMGIYSSTSWYPDLPATALAVTQYYGQRTGSVTFLMHADIIVNDSGKYALSSFATTPTGHYDLPTIMLHELGHFIGVPHTPVSNSVMYPYIKSATMNRALTELDTKDLRTRYQEAISGISSSTIEEGTLIRGIIALMVDGSCNHYENGKFIEHHQL